MKKKSISKLKKELWQLCREMSDKMYPNARCYTCGARISGSNKQLGHFIPSSVCGCYLRYNLRNLRWQCMRCNQFAGGNGAEFYKRMVKEVGQKAVDDIFKDKQKIIKCDEAFIEKKIREYKELLST